MDSWFPIVVIFNLALSWYVSSFYQRRCHCTSQRYRDHGSLEFHLAFFGMNLSLIYFVPSSRTDGWIFGLIGLALLTLLLKRFVQNWIRQDKPEK